MEGLHVWEVVERVLACARPGASCSETGPADSLPAVGPKKPCVYACCLLLLFICPLLCGWAAVKDDQLASLYQQAPSTCRTLRHQACISVYSCNPLPCFLLSQLLPGRLIDALAEP